MTKQMQEVLNKLKSLHPVPIESVRPEIARQLPEPRDAVLGVINDHSAKRLIAGVMETVKEIEHRTIPGAEDELLVRIYRPQGEGPHPVLLYFHGGGWVIANLNSYDASCRSLVNAADCIVVSVAYRQAPEHKYPAARDDAFAAYQWLVSNAMEIGGDPNRIAIAGESAGGNLAAVVCLMAKEHDLPQPVHQLLVYPVTDYRFDTISYNEHADAKPLNREMMKWFWEHYLKNESDGADPLASPLRASDLHGLPPATILTAEIDPLCSEGEAYGDRLRSFGVPVFSKRYDGVTHEFFGMGGIIDEAKEAVKDAAAQLHISFDQTPIERSEQIKQAQQPTAQDFLI